MIDLNQIMNGTRTKKKRQKSNLNSLMIPMGPKKGKLNSLLGNIKPMTLKPRKMPIGLGRQTKAQKRVKRKDYFSDWDGDGVINRLDCAPRNKKKHYWDLSTAKKQGQYVTYMTPQEYLEKTGGLDKRGQPEPWMDTYRDDDYPRSMEKNTMRPISKLSQHIQGSTPVTVPWYGGEQADHEGRHRAYAAQRAGQSVIPVAVKRPDEQRTEDVADRFVDKRFSKDTNRSYRQEWRDRVTKKMPEFYMDEESAQTFKESIREQGMEPEGPATREHQPMSTQEASRISPYVKARATMRGTEAKVREIDEDIRLTKRALRQKATPEFRQELKEDEERLNKSQKFYTDQYNQATRDMIKARETEHKESLARNQPDKNEKDEM